MAALENSRQDIKDTDEINLQIADAFLVVQEGKVITFSNCPAKWLYLATPLENRQGINTEKVEGGGV